RPTPRPRSACAQPTNNATPAKPYALFLIHAPRCTKDPHNTRTTRSPPSPAPHSPLTTHHSRSAYAQPKNNATPAKPCASLTTHEAPQHNQRTTQHPPSPTPHSRLKPNGTRLNSRHEKIPYPVYALHKKHHSP